jgi:hypothetical protein
MRILTAISDKCINMQMQTIGEIKRTFYSVIFLLAELKCFFSY